MVRPCGDCSLCCKVVGIAALDKPAGRWCPHVSQGTGCSIHAEAPAECRGFHCFWALEVLNADEWRPDRCQFVVWTNNPKRIIVDVDGDHPDAWRRDPYYRQIKTWSDRRSATPIEVLVRVRGGMIVIFPETEIDLGPYDLSKRIVSGYRDVDGRPAPFAEYAPATGRA